MVQEGIDRGRDGAAAAVPEHDHPLKTLGEMLQCVIETAKHNLAQGIAGDSDHEQVASAFVEDQLDGDARVRAAKDRRIRALFGRPCVIEQQAKVARVDSNFATRRSGLTIKAGEQSRESAATLIHAAAGSVGILGPFP
jgi:hypothetical protein